MYLLPAARQQCSFCERYRTGSERRRTEQADIESLYIRHEEENFAAIHVSRMPVSETPILGDLGEV